MLLNHCFETGDKTGKVMLISCFYKRYFLDQFFVKKCCFKCFIKDGIKRFVNDLLRKDMYLIRIIKLENASEFDHNHSKRFFFIKFNEFSPRFDDRIELALARRAEYLARRAIHELFKKVIFINKCRGNNIIAC